MPWRERWSFVTWANNSVGTHLLPDPAQPLRRSLRPDPPVLCPALGFDRLHGVVALPENSYFEIFTGNPYGSLCIHRLKLICRPTVSVNNHTSRHIRTMYRPNAASRIICIGKAFARADVDMAMCSAPHVEIDVDPSRLHRHDNGHEHSPTLDRNSRKMSVVTFAVSRSPAESASGDIADCAWAKCSGESVLWIRSPGFGTT